MSHVIVSFCRLKSTLVLVPMSPPEGSEWWEFSTQLRLCPCSSFLIIILCPPTLLTRPCHLLRILSFLTFTLDSCYIRCGSYGSSLISLVVFLKPFGQRHPQRDQLTLGSPIITECFGRQNKYRTEPSGHWKHSLRVYSSGVTVICSFWTSSWVWLS